MPSYQKQPIETILDNQEVQTSMTKVTKFVSGLVNGVEAKAAHNFYGNGWESKNEWWRMGIRLPGSFIEELEWVVGNWGGMIAFGTAARFFYARVLVGVCTQIAALCSGIGFVIAVYYTAITSVNRYRCNKNGVWVYKNNIFPMFGAVSYAAGTPYVGCN
jgi:hypothetical protein